MQRRAIMTPEEMIDNIVDHLIARGELDYFKRVENTLFDHFITHTFFRKSRDAELVYMQVELRTGWLNGFREDDDKVSFDELFNLLDSHLKSHQTANKKYPRIISIDFEQAVKNLCRAVIKNRVLKNCYNFECWLKASLRDAVTPDARCVGYLTLSKYNEVLAHCLTIELNRLQFDMHTNPDVIKMAISCSIRWAVNQANGWHRGTVSVTMPPKIKREPCHSDDSKSSTASFETATSSSSSSTSESHRTSSSSSTSSHSSRFSGSFYRHCPTVSNTSTYTSTSSNSSTSSSSVEIRKIK